jgi:hypothetical protein
VLQTEKAVLLLRVSDLTNEKEDVVTDCRRLNVVGASRSRSSRPPRISQKVDRRLGP